MIYLSENVIFGINGPVVTIKGETDLSMMEMVYVGKEKLIGEVIGLDKKMTTIQVYEETTGLKPGEPVYSTGLPMSVTLGPGIIGNIFDGIERPLPAIEKKFGAFIGKGAQFSPLDTEKKYKVTLKVKVGDTLSGGDIYAECLETPVITHKIMLSPLLSGTVTEVMPDGEYTVNDTVAKIKDKKGNETELTLLQKWPIRNPRPIKKRLPATKPLVTGQRVIDTVFPVAKGGAAAIPGGFGTGKTMTQHQLAKWCDADIIIYVGCGERGNEMTQVLTEFSDITDPKTGRPLLDRTMLIANTSNMPVAAREASIYTGITIAEYYRDMGYDTALMADSTSRWAEALREMSGRLQEMPGEEGYPAYLGSRLAQFYERAGMVKTLGSEGRTGALSVIGAVSPPGGDISEPVSQATLRIVKVFWGLDSSLAYKRHFPAINWLTSYSLYVDNMGKWFEENVNEKFMVDRQKMMTLLQEEAELDEIVKMVGMDALSAGDRLKMEAARSIREDFLHQNSFHDVDTYTPLHKQFLMMELIMAFYEESAQALAGGASIRNILNMPIREKIGRFKYVLPENVDEEYEKISRELDKELQEAIEKED